MSFAVGDKVARKVRVLDSKDVHWSLEATASWHDEYEIGEVKQVEQSGLFRRAYDVWFRPYEGVRVMMQEQDLIAFENIPADAIIYRPR